MAITNDDLTRLALRMDSTLTSLNDEIRDVENTPRTIYVETTGRF